MRSRARLTSWVLVAAASCATAAPPPSGSGGSSAASGTGGRASSSSVGVGGSGGSIAIPLDDGGPPVDAGACAPFAETFTPACLACLATSCCAVALDCFDASDCFGLVNCQQNCPPVTPDAGDTCLDACTQNFPMAMPAYGDMTTCLAASCPTACPY